MFKVASKVEEMIEIKKSKFIATLLPVTSVEDAKNALNEIKHQYFDAKHHCYAYIVGEKGEDIKFSDDGEPAQTAGVVIFNALQKNNLTNVLCVVTRYFGGILLGAGGLTRAYADATSKAINSSTIEEIKKYQNLSMIIDYTFATPILKLLDIHKKLDAKYEEKVTLTYEIEESLILGIKEKLIELTNGTIKFI